MKFAYQDHTYQHELQIFDYIDKIPLADNFYDLGACVGTFSLYAGLRGLTCVAFEVDPFNFMGLHGNVLANNLEHQIMIINRGISDGQTADGVLLVAPESKGTIGSHSKTLRLDESTIAAADRSNFQQIQVSVGSLDNFVEEFELPTPLHIKVDIDGSELAFLRGAPKSLGSLRSMVIEIFEGNPLHQDVLRIIDNAGFKLQHKHPISQDGCSNYFNYEFWR